MAIATRKSETRKREAAPAQNGTRQDVSAALQRGTRDFTELYEREAYRAYNLALRITCRREAAMAATEEAFLRRVGESDPQAGLFAMVVARALAHAKGKPSPNGTGDAEAQRLLAAAAKLAPPERAALALTSVGGAGAQEIAAAMGLPREQAAQLLERAEEQFATALGVKPADARAWRSAWPWAEPPPELWQSLYPKLYRALEQEAGGDDRGAGRKRSRGVARPGRSRRRLAVALVALLAAGAAAFFLLRSDGEEGPAGDALVSDQGALGAAPSVEAPGGGEGSEAEGDSSYDALTPEELDQLRLDELRDLRRYSRREQNRTLTPAERRQASREARELSALAGRRLREARQRERAAARRERQAARQGREGAKRPVGKAPAPATLPDRDRDRGGGGEKRDKNEKQKQKSDGKSGGIPGGGDGGGGGGGAPKNEAEAQQECLYNEDTGTYICP